MSAWWDVDHNLLLITAEELATLPDGEVLTCLDGSTAVKGTDEVDDDTRGGHLAYGVVGNHPLRVAHLEKLAFAPKKETRPVPPHRAWSCTVGVMGDVRLPPGSDLPMRRAVEKAFLNITGKEAEFNFSGWGAQLDEHEYEVVKAWRRKR